jgi:GTP pyrophosphokinase
MTGEASATVGSGQLPGEPLDLAFELLRSRIADARGGSGEPIVAHALGTVSILEALKVDLPTRVAAVVFGAGEALPFELVRARCGDEVASLVEAMRQLLRLKDLTLRTSESSSGSEVETLRRMLLAMASDIRVVLLRLASRLQSLRWHAESKTRPEPAVARETLEVLAPLANRLGLGQLKWELEDLAFRFLEPDLYRSIAQQLEERRTEREHFVQAAVQRLTGELRAQGIVAEVTGRPKHIYSIYNKMRTKGLSFSEVQDLRAFRVLLDDAKSCYAVLGVVHQVWPPIPREFDDYISRPKPNGYRSLHTVVIAEDGRPLEVQIRTREMHRHAEYGIASHWRYKEASSGAAGSSTAMRGATRGARGGGRRSAGEAAQDERVEWMRQLLMWQQEIGATLGGRVSTSGEGAAERIYLLTPQAKVVELPAGCTPVDFAYSVHTGLGHRCRGARVDGQLVPLNTVLRNGQTVEIVVARAGSGSDGPSRDWLNPQLGYIRSQRARTKVRQWFNAAELERDLSSGRERVERVLQREGRTALAHDELARRLGFTRSDDLFLAVSREELGPRALEDAVRAPHDAERAGDAVRGVSSRGTTDTGAQAGLALTEPAGKRSVSGRIGTAGSTSGVLVVGVDFLLTQLAKCCRPAPPDPIVGFVTKGQGVSVHRVGCRAFAEMAKRAPERMLESSWGDWSSSRVGVRKDAARAVYPVDVSLRARDRQGLLRDVSDTFARDRLNVTAVRTMSRGGVADMQFTVEVPDIGHLERTLASLRDVDGVLQCRRR